MDYTICTFRIYDSLFMRIGFKSMEWKVNQSPSVPVPRGFCQCHGRGRAAAAAAAAVASAAVSIFLWELVHETRFLPDSSSRST